MRVCEDDAIIIDGDIIFINWKKQFKIFIDDEIVYIYGTKNKKDVRIELSYENKEQLSSIQNKDKNRIKELININSVILTQRNELMKGEKF